jgi:putative phosphoribosyl transferase
MRCVIREHAVQIPTGAVKLEGDLLVPEGAFGIVVFAHGSGSSRHSPRNRLVADSLRKRALATLLLDLLTLEEERVDLRTRQLRFDVRLLAQRLVDTTSWLRNQEELRALRVGYFGASTGAAAALAAAAKEPEWIRAIVSRGGRPDLAGPALRSVQAPTLFLVGGNDHAVLELNRQAIRQIRAPSRLEIIEGATHLFEEPGALDRVAALAGEWFVSYLREKSVS